MSVLAFDVGMLRDYPSPQAFVPARTKQRYMASQYEYPQGKVTISAPSLSPGHDGSSWLESRRDITFTEQSIIREVRVTPKQATPSRRVTHAKSRGQSIRGVY